MLSIKTFVNCFINHSVFYNRIDSYLAYNVTDLENKTVPTVYQLSAC